MLKNYVRTAWRNILKHKGFSLLNVGGLALGMASCLLLLLYVSYHLNFDKHFKNLDNIYIAENNQQGDGKIYTFAAAPQLLAQTIKAEVPGVEHTARVVDYSAGGLVSYNNNSFEKAGLFADPEFFSIFSYHFIEGDPAKALSNPNSIVLTQDLAQTLFGKADAMGKTVMRNNKTPLMVTGVIENLPPNENFQFDYVLPYRLFEDANAWVKNGGWGSNFNRTIVELKPGVSLNKVNAQVGPIIGKHDDGNTNKIFLFPYGKLHLYGEFENGKSAGGMISQIHLFEILAICILLIACVNFMNLSTARSEERAKEVGIRKAIGSGKRSLIIQFLTESVILSLVSTVIAVIVLVLSIPFFNNLLNIKLIFPYQEWSTWAIIIGFALFAGLVSGSYPAFYLSSFNPIKVLKGVFKGGKNALPIRKVLVVIQFGFSVFLITATICIYGQIRYIQNKSIGYNKDNLVEIPTQGNIGKDADVLVNDLKAKGIITAATGVFQSITQNGNNTWGVDWPGKQSDSKILFDIFNTGFDFTQATGIKLIAGREFSAQFPSDTAGKTVMINETASRLMHQEHIIGTLIKWGGQPYTVVGVYKDFVWGSPFKKIPPMITGCISFKMATAIAVRLNPKKNVTVCVDALNKELKSINPAYPPTYQFVDSEFAKKFANQKLLATLANIFGGLAIIISCLGLFGLAAYAAEQRIKEIGVRKVLGASVSGLAALLSADFLKLVGIAIVLALPLSFWAMHNWLQQFEFHISVSWWILALAALITVIIAMATVSFQAVKAAMANPVKCLRSE